MKECIVCKQPKTIENFRKYKSSNRIYTRSECRKCETNKDKIYKQENELKVKEYYKKHHKEYYLKHKKEINEKSQVYYLLNKEKIRTKQNKNKQKRNERQRIKRQEDQLYKFKYQIRNLINNSFTRRKYRKDSHTREIVGINLDDLYNYLLKTYKDNYGIEWNNQEIVHIDHIEPLANANTEKDVVKLCHYTNLQLLKAKDNMKKGKIIDWELEK